MGVRTLLQAHLPGSPNPILTSQVAVSEPEAKCQCGVCCLVRDKHILQARVWSHQLQLFHAGHMSHTGRWRWLLVRGGGGGGGGGFAADVLSA